MGLYEELWAVRMDCADGRKAFACGGMEAANVATFWDKRKANKFKRDLNDLAGIASVVVRVRITELGAGRKGKGRG